MTKKSSFNLSKLALKRAKNWLQGAQRGLEDERWDDCVYNSQMASEHAIKALFLKLGIHYKRIHDVSNLFRIVQENSMLPVFFTDKIPKYTDIIEELTEQRNLAGYGFEEGINNEYFKEYAPTALNWAKDIVSDIERVLKTLDE